MYPNNPFTLMYGVSSLSLVSREDSINYIINSFINDKAMFMYLITGIRGCGKTVLLRETSTKLGKENDWIVVDINSQGKIITSLANKLFDESKERKLLSGWSLSINLPYLTLTKEQSEQVNDPEIIAEKILRKLHDNNKKVLITIDEVTNTNDFREFVNFYQHLLGSGIIVFLLMTGLKENINNIINDKAMTFLSRAPKIDLEPLSLPNVALEYQRFLNVTKDEAIKMALMTNGYAFAYQVLGYIMYENKCDKVDKNIIEKYDAYLWANGYTKFWNDLTINEKKFLIGLANSKKGSKEEICSVSELKETNYSQYRRRLLEKGLIIVKGYDKLDFVLPRFREFINYAKEFD